MIFKSYVIYIFYVYIYLIYQICNIKFYFIFMINLYDKLKFYTVKFLIKIGLLQIQLLSV